MVRVYDPVKAHEYYERTKKLKGRKRAHGTNSGNSMRGTQVPINGTKIKEVKARIGRLQNKIRTLQGALSEAQAALSKKRQTAAKEKKADSDGKTTAEERRQSKEYRDKHREELKAKRKKAESSGGSSKSKSVDDMSAQELRTRISKIQGTLRDAKQQLLSANQQLGQLAHSAIREEPDANEHFARFQSAERIPSKW